MLRKEIVVTRCQILSSAISVSIHSAFICGVFFSLLCSLAAAHIFCGIYICMWVNMWWASFYYGYVVFFSDVVLLPYFTSLHFLCVRFEFRKMCHIYALNTRLVKYLCDVTQSDCQLIATIYPTHFTHLVLRSAPLTEHQRSGGFFPSLWWVLLIASRNDRWMHNYFNDSNSSYWNIAAELAHWNWRFFKTFKLTMDEFADFRLTNYL